MALYIYILISAIAREAYGKITCWRLCS